MQVILEMFCKGCSNTNCVIHQDKIRKIDRISGLEFEIRCICKNHHDVSEDIKND
jgi:hypothetical protein